MVVADEGRRKRSNKSLHAGYKTEDERESLGCEMGEERLEMDRRERRLNTVILVAAGAFWWGQLEVDA